MINDRKYLYNKDGEIERNKTATTNETIRIEVRGLYKIDTDQGTISEKTHRKKLEFLLDVVYVVFFATE